MATTYALEGGYILENMTPGELKGAYILENMTPGELKGAYILENMTMLGYRWCFVSRLSPVPRGEHRGLWPFAAPMTIMLPY